MMKGEKKLSEGQTNLPSPNVTGRIVFRGTLSATVLRSLFTRIISVNVHLEGDQRFHLIRIEEHARSPMSRVFLGQRTRSTFLSHRSKNKPSLGCYLKKSKRHSVKKNFLGYRRTSLKIIK